MLALLLAFLVPSAPFVAAASAEPASAVTLRIENDVASSSDAYYTAGSSLAYTRNDSGFLGWIWGNLGSPDGKPYSSYELAQLLFTPSDLSLTPPDPRDRPYAGLLYAGLTTGLRTGSSLQALKLLAGVVGPSALGEEGQDVMHKIVGDPRARGWDYQLKDEAFLNVIYEYRQRYRLVDRQDEIALELIPIGTAMLGNYLTKARAEAQLRLGHLPDDFGETSIRGLGSAPVPEKRSGRRDASMYLFVGGGGELVARDLTLDGNSFRSGPGVDKHPFVSSGVVGFSYHSGRFIGSLSYILCGREFEGQSEGERYASLSLSYLLR